ncbi:MAG: LapA family protein [Rhodoferax sp.]|nr:LapA family protein [Rhodoferax sp.]
MSIRSLLLLLICLALAAFVALNWGLVTQPTELSLLVSAVSAPLGLVLLGFTLALAAVFIAVIASMQTTLLMDGRRHTKELAAQRELADKAEASRFTELKTFVAEELVRLSRERVEGAQQLQTRLDGLQAALVQRVDEQANSLAAAVGQLEDHVRSGVARTGGAA